MSDFFSHLIARSLGTAEVVQPRPALRFDLETRAEAAPLPLEAVAPTAQPVVHSVSAPEAPPPQHWPLAETPRLRPTVLPVPTPTPLAPPTEHPHALPAIQSAGHHVENNVRVLIQPSIESVQPLARIEARLSQTPTATEPVTRETHVQHQTFIEGLIERERLAREVQVKADTVGQAVSRPVPAGPRAAQPSNDSIRVTERPERAAPIVQPRIALRPLPSTPKAPTPTEAPTIHVTIGRIEVRATPPAPARPTRPAQRGPSLEDYLHKREAKTR